MHMLLYILWFTKSQERVHLCTSNCSIQPRRTHLLSTEDTDFHLPNSSCQPPPDGMDIPYCEADDSNPKRSQTKNSPKRKKSKVSSPIKTFEDCIPQRNDVPNTKVVETLTTSNTESIMRDNEKFFTIQVQRSKTYFILKT